MNAHTPEPWSIHSTDGSEWALIGPGATIPWICDLKQNAEANARRIQACVNWCAGWDDRKMARDVSPQHMVDAYKRVTKQRDELMKALRKQTDYMAATHGVLRTLPVPSMHAFDGARRYSEVLTPTLNDIANSVAAANAVLAGAAS